MEEALTSAMLVPLEDESPIITLSTIGKLRQTIKYLLFHHTCLSRSTCIRCRRLRICKLYIYSVSSFIFFLNRYKQGSDISLYFETQQYKSFLYFLSRYQFHNTVLFIFIYYIY